MQSLFKLRSVPIMRVRCVMGKPYMGEDWEIEKAKEKKKKEEETSPPSSRFTKSFQEYLKSRLTLEDLMKSGRSVSPTP